MADPLGDDLSAYETSAAPVWQAPKAETGRSGGAGGWIALAAGGGVLVVLSLLAAMVFSGGGDVPPSEPVAGVSGTSETSDSSQTPEDAGEQPDPVSAVVSRPSPPTVQDTTQIWVQACRPLHNSGFAPQYKSLGLKENAPLADASWSRAAAAGKLAQEYSESLAGIRKATELGGGANFEIPTNQGVVWGLEHWEWRREGGDLVKAEAHWKASQNDADGVFEAIKSLLALEQSLAGESAFVSQALRTSFRRDALVLIRGSLSRGFFSDQQLTELQTRLTRSDLRDGLRRSFSGECAIGMNILSDPNLVADMIGGPNVVRMLRYDHEKPDLDKWSKRLIAAAEQPWPKPLLEGRSVYTEIGQRQRDRSAPLVAAPAILSGGPMAISATARAEFQTSAVLAAIAIERVYRDKGALPAKLPGNWADPYTGKPLQYRPSGDRYRIVSAGPRAVAAEWPADRAGHDWEFLAGRK